MALTQSEAINMLAIHMGQADGEFSELEMKEIIINNPVFNKYCEKIDHDLLMVKIKRGECSKDACVQTLKARSLDTQLDALAIVWHVLIADGVMTDGEKELMAELLNDFDIEIEDVNARLEKIKA